MESSLERLSREEAVEPLAVLVVHLAVEEHPGFRMQGELNQP